MSETFKQAFKKSLVEETTIEEEGAPDATEQEAHPVVEEPMETEDPEIPEWAIIPDQLKIPPGRQILFARFKAEWTYASHKGDRHCVLWGLSTADERWALKRSAGDQSKFMVECTKQMIRAFDGIAVSWAGSGKDALAKRGRASVDQFWEDIGPKCRMMLTNLYVKQHHLDMEEQADFFTSCFAVRSSVGD